MFLKSLEVRGFKSFADKTDLKFKKGITAVVGPNGSGKSNVSDAVRWVLGEQSVKSLRGGKMEDVIFAGTQFRKPVNLAQVAITLDNSAGKLPIDYNEVTVSRRIFRSGETEYLINNQKCRLKDITELFMDTGIGKEGYSLIGQGKIDAILSGKPEERRALLEEAAGIVKYKARKEEAEKKLNNTDDNLIRIRDIISTYEERIEPLKKEKEKALKYRELANELKVKEVSIIVETLKGLKLSISDVDNQILKEENVIKEKRQVLNNYKVNFNKLEKEFEKLEIRNKEEKDSYYRKKESINKNKNDIELFKERANNFKDLIKKEKKDIEEIELKIVSLNNEKEILIKEVSDKEQDIKNKDQEINEANYKVESFNVEIIKIEKELEKLKKSEFDFISNKSELTNAIQSLKKEIESNDERESKILEDSKYYTNNLKENEKIKTVTTEKINSINLRIKELESNIISIKEKVNSKYNDLNLFENSNVKLIKKINELEATYSALNNLENHYEGYNRTIKILMENIKKGNFKKINKLKVLGEIVSIDKKYETAIEIALGAAISNLITETDEDAKLIINYLKEKKIGRATFLPLNIIKGKKINISSDIINSKGYIGIASDLVEVDKEYQDIIEYSLGRIIISKDMDSAIKISKLGKHSYKIVTLTGEVINPGGSLTGGSINGKSSNLLSRKRELEEIKTNTVKLKEEHAKSKETTFKFKKEIKELELSSLKNKDQIHDEKINLTRNQSKLENYIKEEVNIKKIITNLNNESDIMKKRNSKLNENLKLKNNQLKDLGENSSKSKDIFKELDESLINKKLNLESYKENIIEMKISRATLEESIQGKKNELLLKQKDLLENSNSKNNFIENIRTKEENIIILEKENKSKNEIIIKLEEEVLTLERVFQDDEINKIEYKAKIKENNELSNAIIEELRSLEIELNKRELYKNRFDNEKENLYKRLNEELNLTMAEAEEIAEEVTDLNLNKEEISKLKGKITSLGVVNLAAIVEYDEVLEKYEFMASQELDLKQAKNELLSLINDMTVKMQDIFKENFETLNENFSETFKELFKGGNGELILDEGDELNANIVINVQPPGKKLQNINLMSGGEKVLSAIALLFAILKMKPTPFCILDEIEAALDDANVFRYAEFLRKFSENIQFVVITHRKGTMEASDIMYGITMEEKGISKVVSVDLSEN